MAHHQVNRGLSCPYIVKLLYSVMWFIIIVNVDGCTSVKDLFKPTPIEQKLQFEKTVDAHSATIYLYRPWRSVAAPNAPMITISGEDILVLRNGSYTKIQVHTGEYILVTRNSGISFKYWFEDHHVINLEQGLAYFVQIVPSFDFQSDYFNISLVDEQAALKEISDTDYYSPQKEVYKYDQNFKIVCKAGNRPAPCNNETKHFHDSIAPEEIVNQMLFRLFIDAGFRSIFH